jgi:hypothetical protein
MFRRTPTTVTQPSSVLAEVRRRGRLFSIASSGALAVGMLGWVAAHYVGGGYWLLEAFAVVTFVGLVGFSILAFAMSKRQPRPSMLKALALGAVAWGIVLLCLGSAPTLKDLLAILGAVEVVLLLILLTDLRSPTPDKQAGTDR